MSFALYEAQSLTADVPRFVLGHRLTCFFFVHHFNSSIWGTGGLLMFTPHSLHVFNFPRQSWCLCPSFIRHRWRWEEAGRDNIHDQGDSRFRLCNNWMEPHTCCCQRGSERSPDAPSKWQCRVDVALRDVMKNVWLHPAVKPHLKKWIWSIKNDSFWTARTATND